MTNTREFHLEGQEFVLLQSLLQLAGLCGTGGEAKLLIVDGHVTVDGEVETRRGKKIRAGQRVSWAGVDIEVLA
ncbi:RNA-binding S4 domain-containing protein [Sporichthya polymorpha]|uniref:RNA-binding S4 domain-containing protein n=1 Tax=Sporichthya polymorpha TaxID=35751 RepID=UPI00036C95DF|nr:RNA-binding S4 domain-containing protein [Sporichthya polymorpha]